ncbi:dipeptidase [Glacieibacterium frigidum]|uniref:Amidohydrolase family protein n=1 Tax=Glacieibacterium frigidum TaxID=2593303 RepID=A0A552UAL7_9SPHN|nr:dipeptidase [Glacieibacterium frigidum]TRW15257.1 amidohydrolase family protein [Glacieibacterium frigidum]
MRRIVFGIAALLVVAVAAFLIFAPGIAERGMNRVVGGPWPVGERARALHAKLFIADLHGDTLLWQRDFDAAATRGQVDLPRLQAGNVGLQVLSSVTKTPKGQNYESNSGDTDNITLLSIAQLQPMRTWGSLVERSLWHAEKLHRAAERAPAIRVVRTRGDVSALRPGVVGTLLSVEGAHNLEGDLRNLDRLYAAGFRMIGLAHFFDNELAGSMHGEKKYGLTPFGLKAVRAMEAKGMIVDVAHASHAAFADVMRLAARPVVVSHGGVKATCDTNRNLTDDELRALAKNGGVIGIGYWDAAVCAPTPQATARAIVHAVKVAGIDHVGLGSDFDGSVTTGFDAAHISAVTQALIDAGLSDADITKVMGGNVRRLLMAGLPA